MDKTQIIKHIRLFPLFMFSFLTNLGTDEQAIIDVLANRSNDQRQKIAKQFKQMFGKVILPPSQPFDYQIISSLVCLICSYLLQLVSIDMGAMYSIFCSYIYNSFLCT